MAKKTHQQKARDAALEAGEDVPEVDVFFDQLSHELRPDTPVIYLVWAVTETDEKFNSTAELRAITSYRERAEIYKRGIERESEYRNVRYTRVDIEETWLNHLYGHSMFKALYDISHDDEVEAVLAEEASRTSNKDS